MNHVPHTNPDSPREALEHVLLWAGDDEPKPACVIDAEAALRAIALAVEGSADGGSSQEASTCPHGIPHRWPCEQCDSPAVQSVALGEPKAIQHPSTRPRSVDDPAGLPGTSNDQQEKQG